MFYFILLFCYFISFFLNIFFFILNSRTFLSFFFFFLNNPPPPKISPLPLPAPLPIGGGEPPRLGEREMAAGRGGRIALVYQDPMSSLTPVHTVGRQIVEAIRAHESVSR